MLGALLPNNLTRTRRKVDWVYAIGFMFGLLTLIVFSIAIIAGLVWLVVILVKKIIKEFKKK